MGHPGLHRLRVPDRTGKGRGLPAGRPERGDGLVELGLLAGGDADGGAGRHQRLRHGPADAPGGARDEGDLAAR